MQFNFFLKRIKKKQCRAEVHGYISLKKWTKRPHTGNRYAEAIISTQHLCLFLLGNFFFFLVLSLFHFFLHLLFLSHLLFPPPFFLICLTGCKTNCAPVLMSEVFVTIIICCLRMCYSNAKIQLHLHSVPVCMLLSISLLPLSWQFDELF